MVITNERKIKQITFTSKNRGQIHFTFTDNGITEIEVDSTVKPTR